MKPLTILLMLVAATACEDTTGPPTELQVENQTGAVIQVLANRCGQPLRVFAMLKDGWRHAAEVPSGCWSLKAQTWPDGVNVGSVEIAVRSQAVNRLTFPID